MDREQKIDNLRAAVTQADWFDPQLNPKIIAFAEHYRTVNVEAASQLAGTHGVWHLHELRSLLAAPVRARSLLIRPVSRKASGAHVPSSRLG